MTLWHTHNLELHQLLFLQSANTTKLNVISRTGLYNKCLLLANIHFRDLCNFTDDTLEGQINAYYCKFIKHLGAEWLWFACLFVFHSPMSFEGITQQGMQSSWQSHWQKAVFIPSAIFGYTCKNSTVQFFMEGKNIHNKAYVMSPWIVAGELDIWSLYKRSAFTSGIIHILWCKTTFCVAQHMHRQATRHKYS